MNPMAATGRSNGKGSAMLTDKQVQDIQAAYVDRHDDARPMTLDERARYMRGESLETMGLEWAGVKYGVLYTADAHDLDRGTCTITRCNEPARVDGRCWKHEVGRR